jgi:hypothetical protein
MKNKSNDSIKCNEIITGISITNPYREISGKIGAIEYKGGAQSVVDKKVKIAEGHVKEIAVPQFSQDILCLPEGVGSVDSAESLYLRTKELISEIAQLPDEKSLVVCTTYVYSTWLYDLYADIGYLALVAGPGCGKTTLLQAMSRLSYNSVYFSGAASDSSIFRTIDAVKGTLCLEEAQRNSTDHGSDFHKMLAVGINKFGNIPRSAQIGDKVDFKPEVYSVFCPKILCGRSIPGDEAILSRCLGIYLRKISLKEKRSLKLKSIQDPEWCASANALRNDMLLYRQRRKLGDVNSTNFLSLIDDRIEKLEARDYQVVEWLLSECPNSTDLITLFDAVLDNQERVLRRKEEHIEPSVLYVLYDLFIENNHRKVYLTDLVDILKLKFGIVITTRYAASICEQNNIERNRHNKGRYILASADLIADRICRLGFKDPRESTLSSLPTRINQLEESDKESNNGF